MHIFNLQNDLEWHGNELRMVKDKAVIMTIVPDPDWPKMWRVRKSDGTLTDMVNRTRAKDAAGFMALRELNADRRASGASPMRFPSGPVS